MHIILDTSKFGIRTQTVCHFFQWHSLPVLAWYGCFINLTRTTLITLHSLSITGNILGVETCRAEHIYPLVAEKMALFHRLSKNEIIAGNFGSKPMLWDKIRSFIDLLPERFPDESKQERYDAAGMTFSFLPKA